MVTHTPGSKTAIPPSIRHSGARHDAPALGGTCHWPASHTHALPLHDPEPGTHTAPTSGAAPATSARGGGGAVGARIVRPAATSDSGTRQKPASHTHACDALRA